MTLVRALEKNLTGEPYVGKPLVRFDEGWGGVCCLPRLLYWLKKE